MPVAFAPGSRRASRRSWSRSLVEGAVDARAAPHANPGRIVKRQYALRLRCSGCDVSVRRLRALPPPGADLRGRSSPPRRPSTSLPARTDKRIQGHSYPQACYEDAIGGLFDQVGAPRRPRRSRRSCDGYLRSPGTDRPRPMPGSARARGGRTRRLARTRDVLAWQRDMAQLDAGGTLARGKRSSRTDSRPPRLSPTCAPCRRSGQMPVPTAVRRSCRASSQAPMSWGSSRSSTS